MQRRLLAPLFIFAPLITLIAALAYQWLPAKKVTLFDKNTAQVYLFADNENPSNPGLSTVTWTNKQRNSSRCILKKSDAYPYCGIAQLMSPDRVHGVDLSKYHTIEVDFDYNGPAEKLRLHIRNFNDAYSRVSLDDSNKFNYAPLEVNNSKNPHIISMSDLSVADWWIEKYNISRKHSHPEFNNVITIGIDFAQPFPYGVHELTINKITFKGQLISRASWYLGILCAWLACFFFIGAYLLLKQFKQTKKDARLIAELADYNEKLQSQSENYKSLSRIDPLTTLYNRFGFTQMVEQVLAKLTPGASASLIGITINGFSQLQKAGREECDNILSESAGVIRRNCRGSFSIARWEREEFLVLCPNLMGSSAYQVAEQIRKDFQHHEFPSGKIKNISVRCAVLEMQPAMSFADNLRKLESSLNQAQSIGITTTFLAG